MKIKKYIIYVFISVFSCLLMVSCAKSINKGMIIEFIDEPIMKSSDEIDISVYNINYELNNLNFNEIESIVLTYKIISNKYMIGEENILLIINTDDFTGVKSGKLNIFIDKQNVLHASLDCENIKAYGEIPIKSSDNRRTFKMLKNGENINFDEESNILEIDSIYKLKLSNFRGKDENELIDINEELSLLITKKSSEK